MVVDPLGPRTVVLAAPSGAGKTTIARRLVRDVPEFVFSVSATTRAPRPGEREGVDYHFLEPDAFRAMIESGDLAEWAEVHGRLYGTPVRNLDEAARRGLWPLLDIDVQGARQIRERVDGALTIFVLPPSTAVWLDRLRGRGTEGRDELVRRLESAASELDEVDAFDVVVVNDELDATVERVRAVIRDGAPGLDPDEVRGRVEGLRAGVVRELETLDRARSRA